MELYTANVVTDQSLISSTPDHVASQLNGDTVILHLQSGQYFGLNEVGSYVWNLIQQPTSLAALRSSLLETYDVELDQCDRDLKSLLHDLSHAGLIEINPG